MQCENDSLSDVRGHDEEVMDLPKWPVGLTTLTLMSQSLSVWICVLVTLCNCCCEFGLCRWASTCETCVHHIVWPHVICMTEKHHWYWRTKSATRPTQLSISIQKYQSHEKYETVHALWQQTWVRFKVIDQEMVRGNLSQRALEP